MDFLSFQVAGDVHAVSLPRVREVSIYARVTRVPGAPPAIRGVIGLRGAVIPVVDTAVRLGRRPTLVSPRTALVYADALVEGATVVVGLMVDALEGLLGLDPDDVLPPPLGLRLREKRLLAGLGRVGDRLVPLLDVDALVAPHGVSAAAPLGEPAAGREDRVEEGVTPSREAGGEALEASPTAGPPCPAAPPEAVARRPTPSTRASSARAPAARSPGPAPSKPAARPRANRPSAASRRLSEAAGGTARGTVQGALPVPGPSRQTTVPPPGARRAGWVGGLVAGGVALALLLAEAADLRGSRGDARSNPNPVRGQPALAPGAPGAGWNDAPPLLPTSRILRADRPSPAPSALSWPPEVIHEVRAGDTLWALSRRYYGDPFLWPEIFASNRPSIGNPNLITPGERLRVPPRR